MIPDAELAVRYVFAWMVREQTREVAGDDAAGDAGMARLHDLVSRRLGQDPALTRAREEAAGGGEEPSERTRRRLTDSLADAAEQDAEFAAVLGQIVEQLRSPHRDTDGVSTAEERGDANQHTARGPVPERRGAAENDAVQRPWAGAGGDHVDFRNSVITGPVVGAGEQHIHFTPPRSPAPWPHQVGTIPPTAGFFQHRVEAARLREALAGGNAAVLVGQDTVRGRVLTGMGGVGKTQLAADYARTVWRAGEVDVLVWVSAGASSAVVSRYAQAAVEVLGADPAAPEAAAQAFLAWLEPTARREPCRWLVVLDDVREPADLRGLWPPASPHGRTLVTTRRQDAALTRHGGRLIRIGLFTPAESLAYLTAALAPHDRYEPVEQLAALADDLGHLPLALSQAAAYLVDVGIGVHAYRLLLADRTRTLADAAPDALPDDQPHAMDAAWSLSVDRADTLRPAGLARLLLRLASFLDPNGIPESVLTSEPVLFHLTAALREGSQRQPVAVTREQVRQALSVLRRLSLVDHTASGTDEPMVRVHQLIQRATRDTLSPQDQDSLARTAADALLAAWPAIERDTGLAQSLRANTTALTACTENALYRPDVHRVLSRVGNSLGESGQVTAAVNHFRRLAETAHGHGGPDRVGTLNARHALAHWRGEAGDAAGAVNAFTGLLNDMVRVLGPDHLDTLVTRNNFAYWRGQAGDAAGAADAFAELLKDRWRMLGAAHPHTMETFINFAHWRGAAGDAAGAADALADMLELTLPIWGRDHPYVLAMRRLLPWWRGEAGDAAGAVSAFTELLDDMTPVRGPDHPDVLAARKGLAHWRGKAGDAAGAAAALAELLEDVVPVLGPDHPDTLVTRNILAHWRGEAGDAAGAAVAYPEVVEDMVRVLGPDHPETLLARANFADWRGQVGDTAGAADALAELVEDMVRVLGRAHPSTLFARGNLAFYREQAGRADGAAAAYTELLEDMLRVLGPDHPHTFITLLNLVRCRQDSGLTDGPAATEESLLADMERLLGTDHLRTLAASPYFRKWAALFSADG